MKIHLLLALAFVYVSATAQQFNRTIYFENDESVLDESDKVVITELVNFLKKDDIEISSIEIYGFADTSASVNYNKTLSKKRCDVVFSVMESNIPVALKDNVTMHWFGELKEGDTKKDLHYSQRCVDVFITYKEIKSKDNISELFDQLRTPTQKFKIDPTRDTILIGESGTIISIDADAFYIPKSCVGQDVDIVLLEAYDPLSMYLNNLSTMSNSKQLESDGMIFLNAQLCNRILTVKEDKPLTIMFPTAELKEEMQLFSGVKTESGNINWVVSQNELAPFADFKVEELLNRYHFYNKKYIERCPLFFCQIKNLIGMDSRVNSTKVDVGKVDYVAFNKYKDSICAVYGVRSYYQLCKLMEERENKNFESKIGRENIAASDWSYYITKTTDLGWMNCDRFLELPENKRTNIIVEQKPADNINISLVFTEFKSMMATNNNTFETYGFANVKKESKCYVVALKYEDKKPFLSLQKVTIAPDLVIKPEFKEYSIAELKKELSKL